MPSASGSVMLCFSLAANYNILAYLYIQCLNLDL